jgi:hypothetical protein
MVSLSAPPGSPEHSRHGSAPAGEAAARRKSKDKNQTRTRQRLNSAGIGQVNMLRNGLKMNFLFTTEVKWLFKSAG